MGGLKRIFEAKIINYPAHLYDLFILNRHCLEYLGKFSCKTKRTNFEEYSY